MSEVKKSRELRFSLAWGSKWLRTCFTPTTWITLAHRFLTFHKAEKPSKNSTKIWISKQTTLTILICLLQALKNSKLFMVAFLTQKSMTFSRKPSRICVLSKRWASCFSNLQILKPLKTNKWSKQTGRLTQACLRFQTIKANAPFTLRTSQPFQLVFCSNSCATS